MIALPSEYRDRLVAFVDILGWSKAVRERQRLQDVIQAIFAVDREIFIARSALRHHPEADIHWTTFSDCIVFSCGIGSPGDIVTVLTAVCRLYVELLEVGFMCRGAVVVGPAIHRNEIVIGPALVDAVTLERELATFPRIVIREEDLGKLGDVLEEREVLRQSDKVPFLNTLIAHFPFGEENAAPRDRRICDLYAAWFRRLQALKLPSSSLPRSIEEQKILSKHEWLVDHIRHVAGMVGLQLDGSS
jgi:hypothetical protein